MLTFCYFRLLLAGGGGGGGSSYASATGLPGGPRDLGLRTGLSTARFRHTQAAYGSGSDGSAVMVAMPQAKSGLPRSVRYTSANISGYANPRYLASTPTIYYSTDQPTIDGGMGSTATMTSMESGATVLSGATMQPVSAVLNGLSAGTTYYYRVCARSAAGAGCGLTYSFATPPYGAPYFTSDSPAYNIPSGWEYHYNFTAESVPDNTITFSVSSGDLPPGLMLDATTGELAGVPAAPGGVFNFTIRATNVGGFSDSQQSITIYFLPSYTSTTTSTPSCTTTASQTRSSSITQTASRTGSQTSSPSASSSLSMGATVSYAFHARLSFPPCCYVVRGL